MTQRCKSTLRVYGIGAEDRVYEAISTSSHSGSTVRQIAGPALVIQVLDTRSAPDGIDPSHHTVEHLVVGIEGIRDPATLDDFLQAGLPGQRRYALTDYEIFGANLVPGD